MQTMPPQAPPPAAHRPSIPTAPDGIGIKRQRRVRLARRVFLVALALFVLAGLAGLLGVRQGSVFNSSEGWTLEVKYAKVTRAGLAVPMEWRITKAGGFGAEEEAPKVVVRITQDYFDLFDENGFDPEPSTAWSDGEFLYWEFNAPPDHDVMTISVDTRTGSSVQMTSKTAESSIVFDDRHLAAVTFKTWVMP